MSQLLQNPFVRPAIGEVRQYTSNGGARVYQFILEAFPGLWTYCYVICLDDMRILVDTGSGFSGSNDQLEAGFRGIARILQAPFSLKDLTHVLITHGHIDHFGGLVYVHEHSEALVGVHELDRRNISNYEERLVIVRHRLNNYFIESGIDEGERKKLMDLYQVNKVLFRSVPVDFTFEQAGMRLGPLEMLHVPGHCAGHVVIRLHNLLFSGDHVLNRISPHMAPESITSHTGLAHYLESLQHTVQWAGDVELVLAGHEAPVENLAIRVEETRQHHMGRLEKVLDLLLDRPKTTAEISQGLFGQPKGYDAILGVEEAGAHMEYLYQRGLIGIENIGEVEASDGPVPIRYRKL